MLIYSFNESKVPGLLEVGGKAKGLIETRQAGMPVPEGFVLSVAFFSPWMAQIKASDGFKNAMKSTTKATCDALKIEAEQMTFDEQQKAAFDKALEPLEGSLFAVRSSSPEEDLAEASFAGMYDTYLGTRRSDLEIYITKAFASCFDFRVMDYKRQKSLPLEQVAIAIIVQRQIASDISGVGFSLNPLNNAYDEVMINGNFGLGETIVSGIVIPDTYIYDWVSQKIIEKKINRKEITMWLNPDGGTVEKLNFNRDSPALNDRRIAEVSALVKKCEAYYGMPIDTEWAYEHGHLYLLQSRPITSYLPFFEALLTEPGAPKRFYVDIMVMTQGFEGPMSVLGMELWSTMLDQLKFHTMTPQLNGTCPSIHGREYMSVTAVEKLLGKKTVKKVLGGYDGNVRKIFDDIDLEAHPFKGKPEGTKKFKSAAFSGVVRMIPNALKAVFGDYKTVVNDYNSLANKIIEEAKSLDKDQDFKETTDHILKLLTTIMTTISCAYAGLIASQSIKKMFKGEDIEKELVAMNMDLEGNPTSEMGHLLFDMACNTSFKDVVSREAFIEKSKVRSFDEAFMGMYDVFMEKYAVRGFKEIDVATIRVYEDVGLLYDKLIEINTEVNQILKVKEKRSEAYKALLEVAKGKGIEKKFIKAAEKLQGTFGYREHPKYVIVYIFGMLHKMCMTIGQQWTVDGRLEAPNQIFDLKVADIAKAQKDQTFDLMAAREKHLEGYKKVAHIKHWPLVIDSRGKIYEPKLEAKDGDLVGDAIAPGKITGKVKVLHTPYEKSLKPGEILVTRGTEPSWTPIFTNAAGVIMEIGGPLQHGGIIAREYGIPCVSGLMGIMDLVKDGDLVEVDGYNGVVRLLET